MSIELGGCSPCGTWLALVCSSATYPSECAASEAPLFFRGLRAVDDNPSQRLGQISDLRTSDLPEGRKPARRSVNMNDKKEFNKFVGAF